MRRWRVRLEYRYSDGTEARGFTRFTVAARTSDEAITTARKWYAEEERLELRRFAGAETQALRDEDFERPAALAYRKAQILGAS